MATSTPAPAPNTRKQESSRPPRPRRRAAVTLTTAPGERLTPGEIMKEACRVKIQEIGIVNVRYRRAMTGGVILEVAGKDSAAKAEALAEKLRKVFEDRKEVKVA